MSHLVAAIPWSANEGERRESGKPGAAGVAIMFQPFQQASLASTSKWLRAGRQRYTDDVIMTSSETAVGWPWLGGSSPDVAGAGGGGTTQPEALKLVTVQWTAHWR